MATKSVVSLLERSGLVEVEVLPWPSSAQSFASDGSGDALAEDLAEGRLAPALVLAQALNTRHRMPFLDDNGLEWRMPTT